MRMRITITRIGDFITLRVAAGARIGTLPLTVRGRGLIRRDVDLPDGASLGTINLAGPDAFIPIQRTLTVSGVLGTENLGYAVSYLTAATCTVNSLISRVGGSFIYGVPDPVPRAGRDNELDSPVYSSSTLRISDGVRSMVVNATSGYTGALAVILSTPDLSGVSGWPSALAIASGAHGNWMVTANGASSTASLCTEGMRTILASQSGTF